MKGLEKTRDVQTALENPALEGFLLSSITYLKSMPPEESLSRLAIFTITSL